MIRIDIYYPMTGTPRIKTNAKPEMLESILETWIACQVGKGKDTSKAKEKDEYHITIQLDLSDDSFITRSDTGNKSLTAGIVMVVFRDLANIKVEEL